MNRVALLSMTLILMSSCAISIGNTKKTSPPESVVEVDREVGYLKSINWFQYLKFENLFKYHPN